MKNLTPTEIVACIIDGVPLEAKTTLSAGWFDFAVDLSPADREEAIVQAMQWIFRDWVGKVEFRRKDLD